MSNEKDGGHRADNPGTGPYPTDDRGDRFAYEREGFGAAVREMRQRLGNAFGLRSGRKHHGARRSDETIRADVVTDIAAQKIDAGDVIIAVKDGVVTLSGFVREESDAVLVEAIADHVLGVRDVDNQIHAHASRDTAAARERPGAEPSPANARTAGMTPEATAATNRH